MRRLDSFIGEEFGKILSNNPSNGAKIETKIKDGLTLTSVVLMENNNLNRPAGNYYTIDLPNFSDNTKSSAVRELSKIIRKNLPKEVKSVLLLGMGNFEVVSDSLGVKTIEKIDIYDCMKNKHGVRVAKFCPGVVSVSGMESFDLSRAVCDISEPDVIIVVDSLCTSSLDRLGNSIQLTDVGITPGSAVGSSLCELSERTLGGKKVLSVGVPVVVYLKSVIDGLIKKTEPNNNSFRVLLDNLEKLDGIYSPKDIDFLINFLSGIVSRAIIDAI